MVTLQHPKCQDCHEGDGEGVSTGVASVAGVSAGVVVSVGVSAGETVSVGDVVSVGVSSSAGWQAAKVVTKPSRTRTMTFNFTVKILSCFQVFGSFPILTKV